jgi:hypothetical protein
MSPMTQLLQGIKTDKHSLLNVVSEPAKYASHKENDLPLPQVSITAIKAPLQYGEYCSKLVSFREQKIFYLKKLA